VGASSDSLSVVELGVCVGSISAERMDTGPHRVNG
jgi:hypothetical protein